MKKLFISLVFILFVAFGVYSQCPTFFSYTSDSLGVTTFVGYTDDSLSTYSWNFGDGTSATGQYVTHNFNNGSWNYVCLSTINSNQFQCTFCDTVVVNDTSSTSPCNTYFTSITDSQGNTTFAGYSNNPLSTYYWNFGDGTTSTGQNTTHHFGIGTYYVCLNTDSCSYCNYVSVNDSTTLDSCNTYFTYASNIQGYTTFTGHSNDSLSTYTWTFTNGTTATGQTVTHYYGNVLYGYACLTTVSSSGTQCSYCDTVFVNSNSNPCSTSFNSSSDSQGNTAFAGYSNDTISSYYWDFGDGTSATGQNVTHQFTNGSTYYVCLNTINSSQYQCTYCNYVSVNDSTILDSCNTYFMYASDIQGNTTFTGYSNDPLSTYTWTFGNGTTATGQTVTHHYGNVLYGYACLTTVSSSGTQCSYCDTVFVVNNSNPCNLYVTATSITNETGIGTDDGSININVLSGIAPFSFIWSNGATTQNISGLQEGNYNVSVTDANQCHTWATFEVYNDYINQYFNDSLNTSPIDTCLNFVPDTAYIYSFAFNSNNNIVSTTWIIFDITGTQMGFVTANYTCDSAGNYIALLTIVCAKGTYHFSDQIHIAEQTLGISATDASVEEIKLFPNPVADKLYISLILSKSAQLTVNVMDITGQVLYTEISNAEGGQNIIELNTSSLSSGFYFVQINYNGQIISRKFVK